jgi:hypothetical protein
MLVLGAPQLAISHKNSLDICLSNIGGRPGRLPLRLEIIDRTRADGSASPISLAWHRPFHSGHPGSKPGLGRSDEQSLVA